MAVWSEVNTTAVITAGRLDSEFYRKDYLDSLNLIRNGSSYKLNKINLKIVSGPFGSSLQSSEYINKGIPFIRISDLENYFIKKNDLVYISEYSNAKIKGSQLNTGDLVLSKVGNSIGIVSIVDEDFACVNISENNIGIRFGMNVSDEMKSFLVVYLNSMYGQKEILRRRSGNAQPKLNVSDIYDLEVPNIDTKEIKYIHNTVTKIKALTKLSQSLYTQAQELLERELGLDRLVFDKPLSYEAHLSEVVWNNRTDADYYQTRYKQIRKKVSDNRNGFQRLINFATVLRPNIDPTKSPSESFSYIELADINPILGIINTTNTFLGKELPSRARRQVSKGDVIASSVIGSVDKAALVDDINDSSLASTGFFHFRPINNIKSEFLLLLVRSKCVTMQLQQESTGGILSAVPDERLRNVIVPNFDTAIQDRITDLVAQSHQNFKQSKELIEQAKRCVEELIEQAVQK